MHARLRKIAPIILIIIVTSAVIWYFTRGQVAEPSGKLSASGIIEATQVTIAAELGGKVIEVIPQEGDQVQAGDVLVRLDDTLLMSQLEQAKSQLAQAEANYALVAAGTPRAQRQAAATAAELEQLTAQQTLDQLDEMTSLQSARLWQEISQVEKALDQAKKRVDSLNTASDPADIDAARAQVVLARDKLDRAHEDFAPYEKKPEDNLVRAGLQAKLAEAQQRYDQTVNRLNNLLGKVNQLDLVVAEADQALFTSQLADARRRYDEIKDGPDPDAIARAQAQLAAATARLEAAQANPTVEQLALAQAQVKVVQSSIDVLTTQLSKLILTAPSRGAVLNRSVEPGEIAVPAAPLLTLADLEALTITIFIPEDRYGEINLGDEAVVQVDSFPGGTFTASVVKIADQAEFTPRNVQTADGRRTTVFAVQLRVENPHGRLKPGMPADVTFE